jgi:hypothetical protein
MARKNLGGSGMRGLVKSKKWKKNRLALLEILAVPRWLTLAEISAEFKKTASSDSTLHKHLTALVSYGGVSHVGTRYIITERGIDEMRHLQKELSRMELSDRLPTVRVRDAMIVRIPSDGPAQESQSCSGTIAFDVDVKPPNIGTPTVSKEVRSRIGSLFSEVLELVPGSHRIEIHFGGNR